METIQEAWSGILEYLHGLDDISEVAYNVWISCIHPVSVEDGEVVVRVHTNFQRKIVSQHYASRLKEAFENVLGIPLGLKILSEEDNMIQPPPPPPPGTPVPVQEPEPGNLFGQKSSDYEYSFENFIVGSSNKFAHAAAQAVASKPAGYYNPCLSMAPPDWGKPICCMLFATRSSAALRR